MTGQYLRLTLRESRGAAGRLAFFAGCLAIGVAAVVVVATISNSLAKGVRSEAKELLAADLAVSSREPLPPELDFALDELAVADRTHIREQPTLVVAPPDGPGGGSLLAELKVVRGEYPFYGSLDLEPNQPLTKLLAPNTAVVAPDILHRLNLKAGDEVLVGGARFRIAGVAQTESDRITGFMYLGPRVLLSEDAFARTTLANSSGTGARYRMLVKFPADTTAEQLESAVEQLKAALPPTSYQRVETYTDGRPQLQDGLERMDRYLGLAALLSLLLGGVGVAQAVRAWIAGRMDAIAVLKCVGMRPREVMRLYLGQAFLLGLIGSLIGGGFGVLVLHVVPPFFREHIPVELLDPWQPLAFLRGIVLGVIVSLVFCIPPLVTVLRVPPARVLRREAEPLPGARQANVLTAGAIVLGIALLAVYQSGSALLGVIFTGGVLGTAVLLALAAYGLTKAAARMPRDLANVSLRHGLASIARPGASTIASIVALGFGVLILFTARVVQTHLNHQLASELPVNAPSAVLIDVRPEQTEGIERIIAERGGSEFQALPLVIGRITAIDGRPSAELVESGDDDSQRRQIRRQQWMSYQRAFPSDNTILDGRWFQDDGVAEISLEKDYARRINAEVGTTLSFDVGGKGFDVVVSSIRDIRWRELGMNFELLLEPGIADSFPQMRLATARFPDGTGLAIQEELVAAFPNVTIVQVGEVLDRIALQLTRIGWGVRFLGLFIVAAGLAVLAGTVGIESHRRGREVALLKTIGMTRRDVIAVFATEYALLGLVAGIIGIVGGGITAYLVITRGFEIDFLIQPGLYIAALAAAALLAVVAGIAASTRALNSPPIEVLRYE